jgi:peptidoglycan/LPS O-acetylase OafA/YrhL
MAAKGVEGKFLVTVEALRGIAALSVAWFHLTYAYPPNWVRHTGAYGELGVEVFFVISGFIIPYSLFITGYKIRSFPRFMLRRLVRLEPPYLFSIIISLIIAYLSALTPGFKGEPPNYSITQVAAHFFYLIPLTGYAWINIVYWTLAYEFVFYIFVGFFFSFIARRADVISSSAVLLFAGFCILYSGLPPRSMLFLLFLLGIVSFRFFVGISFVLEYVISIVILCIFIFISCGSVITVVSLSSSLFICFAKIPEIGILRFLANISYSLYLIHVPISCRVVNLGRRLCDDVACEFGLSLLALIISLGVAVVFSRLIEEPAKLLARRISID